VQGGARRSKVARSVLGAFLTLSWQSRFSARFLMRIKLGSDEGACSAAVTNSQNGRINMAFITVRDEDAQRKGR